MTHKYPVVIHIWTKGRLWWQHRYPTMSLLWLLVGKWCLNDHWLWNRWITSISWLMLIHRAADIQMTAVLKCCCKGIPPQSPNHEWPIPHCDSQLSSAVCPQFCMLWKHNIHRTTYTHTHTHTHTQKKVNASSEAWFPFSDTFWGSHLVCSPQWPRGPYRLHRGSIWEAAPRARSTRSCGSRSYSSRWVKAAAQGPLTSPLCSAQCLGFSRQM